jgi:indole-3-glycerol phosphate synthase
MDVLTELYYRKQKETALRKKEIAIHRLEQSALFKRPVLSLCQALSLPQTYGIIPECKQSTPEFGEFNTSQPPSELCNSFVHAGAAALAIHTDQATGGWPMNDLFQIGQHRICPIIQSDFAVDEYQILEARAYGADAVLFVAGLLPERQLILMLKLAKSLGLEVLLEVQTIEDLCAAAYESDALVVNNKNRAIPGESTTLPSWELHPALPLEAIKISKGSISDPQSIVALRTKGYQGFMIGTHFLRQENPGAACGHFIQHIQNLDNLLRGAIA